MSAKEEKNMICSLSNKLDENAINEIKSLENQLGKTILAFSCHDVKPDKLDENQLASIQSLENKLGLSLVAVEA
jgi:hypothetical protein